MFKDKKEYKNRNGYRPKKLIDDDDKCNDCKELFTNVCYLKKDTKKAMNMDLFIGSLYQTKKPDVYRRFDIDKAYIVKLMGYCPIGNTVCIMYQNELGDLDAKDLILFQEFIL